MLLSAYLVPHPPIILPEIGKGEERRIQNTINAYHKVAKEIAELQPETIVILSSHAPSYIDYIHISPGHRSAGDFSRFHHPECGITADYDTELVERICAIARRNRIPAGKRGDNSSTLDHGTMIPLYFIDQYLQNYRVVRISVSALDGAVHDQLGQCITAAAEDLNRKIVVIASGDLSHRLSKDSPYGLDEAGKIFDQQVIHALQSHTLTPLLHMEKELMEHSGQCGLPTLQMLHGVLLDSSMIAELYSYEHPFGIGYAICAFHKPLEDVYCQLARNAINAYLEEQTVLQPSDELPTQMHRRSAVFVSLYRGKKLRGCIGSIQPHTVCMADEIIHNAIAAATQDPRFPAVELSELNKLTIHVDVLSRLEPVFFIDELDPKQYGLIVTSSQRRGVLLPNLPAITTPEQQLQTALEKARIVSDDYYTMERFTIEHH